MYRLTIKDLLDRFRDGSLSCEAYTRRVIKRAEKLKTFNYFISMDTDRMLQEAKASDARYRSKTNRPLEGIPIAIKDNIDIEGEATGGGTPGLAGLKPKHTAEVAKRLFDAGAVHAGRTNMHELAYGASTINFYTGTSHNFHNFDYTCGGSSGGSGGAVAADIVPVALGTDCGGSIRVPASYNGSFGLKPTNTRWPAAFGLNASRLRDAIGPITRSAEDISILDQIITGEDASEDLAPNEIRIGVPRAFFWENLDHVVQEYAESFLESLQIKGFVIVDEGTIPSASDSDIEKVAVFDRAQEMLSRLKEYLSYQGHGVTVDDVIEQILSPDVKKMYKSFLKNPASEEMVRSGMKAREGVVKDTTEYFKKNQVDCILMPTTKIPAPLLSKFDSDIDNQLMELIFVNTNLANICNHPSVTIPGGISRFSAVPFGMQIQSMTGSDRRLIAVARAIQKVLMPNI